MLNLRVAPHVRHHSGDHGGVIILDAAKGQWLALNATAGDFWRVWSAGGDLEEGVRVVADRHPSISPERVRTDAERLVNELVGRGLLVIGVTSAGNVAPPSPRPLPSTTGDETVMAESAVPSALWHVRWGRRGLAFCVLAVTCLVVRCSSFRIQLALVGGARRLGRRTAMFEEATEVVAAVGWAVRYYPGRAACLEQSLAAVLLAAAAGRQLDWWLGALTDPYRFHAWVEVEGRPIPAVADPRSLPGYIRLLSA